MELISKLPEKETKKEKKSLKTLLLLLIMQYKVVPIGLLRNKATQNGYIESNAERQLRLLRKEGQIEVMYNEKGFVKAYKLAPYQPTIFEKQI